MIKTAEEYMKALNIFNWYMIKPEYGGPRKFSQNTADAIWTDLKEYKTRKKRERTLTQEGLCLTT